MKLILTNRIFSKLLRVAAALAWAFLAATVLGAAPQSAATKATAPPVPGAKLFNTPEQAVDALVDAAAKFDVDTLYEIFGPNGEDIYLTGEYPQDRQRALDFAAEAHEKKSVSVDPKTGNRAFLIVGDEDWPFPVPLVKLNEKWHFEAKAGSQELFYRRIGSNELDAIDICHGYVEAQYEYAYQPREGYTVNQFAQRITSTPGKQDGLAWQNADGTWGGPVGEKIARAIEQGYSPTAQPYHGYFYKILKGQGPAAPLGEMNYVVEGAMIGGFALVAAPAEYGVTGLKTFIVSNDGIVYQKDFGPATLNEFIKMELFNPDQSWTPVPEGPEEEGKDLIENRLLLRKETTFGRRVGMFPDLYIDIQAAVGTEKQFTSYNTGWGSGPGWGRGWYGYGGGMSSTTTTGSTSTIYVRQLGLDMYDSAKKELVWRGVASKTIDPKAKPERQQKNITKAVDKLLKNYPPPIRLIQCSAAFPHNLL